MIDQIKGQRFTTCDVVGAAGDLDQATAAIRLAVAVRLRCIAQALCERAGVVFAQVLVAAQFAHLRMLRSTCCAAAASRNLHGTQRYLLKTT